MKEVTTEIRKHFIDTITPIAGFSIINLVSQDTQMPFILVSTRSTGAGTKCTRDWLVSTTIDIVVKTDGKWGGDKLTEDVANQLYEKIDSGRPSYATTDNFKISTQTVEAADPILEMFNNGRVIRKTIIVENYVSLI